MKVMLFKTYMVYTLAYLSVTVGFLTLSCSDTSSSPACIENETQICICPDGAAGTQVCQEDGTWTACSCDPAASDADTDVDIY